MAVNLSPYGGVGAQFLDNAGNVLTGGKIFTYAGGTTTPQVTYTSGAGTTPLANPIILDAAGRVPTGEIWLTDGQVYKFVLKDSNDVLIATYDGITGINSNFVNFTNQQEIQTATAGQTVFNLTTMTYQPGTNSLSVFVDGVNQYGPGSSYAYLETDSDTVTFVTGLHVGAEVKFTTSNLNSSTGGDAFNVSYLPPFTGAVGTNVGLKLAQTVSVMDFGAVGDGVTDDSVGIQAAVDYCVANDSQLYWPEGTYLTTASVNDFHTVNHIGSGAVSRGSDVFYPNPSDNQSNILYVSPAGLATNDGLSILQPLNSMANLFATLKNYGPTLNGQWTAKLSASSSYDYGVTLENLYSVKEIIIEGPDVGGHPNIPTAIVGPSVTPAASGWRFIGCRVKVRNVKFINFRSSSSAFALAIRDQGFLETENVHVDNDTTSVTTGGLGIVGNGLCVLNVKGGIIEHCAEGIRSLFNCYHYVGTQNAGNLLSGPIIKNNQIGFSARESSSGHSDWVSYEDNEFGISSEVNARVNCSFSDFKRNTVAIRVRDGNVLRAGCTYNLGTADANDEVIRSLATGTDFNADSNSLNSLVRYRDVTTNTIVTGTTNETVLANYDLTAGDYMVIATSTYVGKCVRVKARGSLNGTAGAKTIRLRFGGLGGTNMNAIVAVAASTGRWEYETEVFIRGNIDQRVYGKLFVSNATPVLGAGSFTYDMSTNSDISLVVTGQLGNSTDDIRLDFFQIEVEG